MAKKSETGVSSHDSDESTGIPLDVILYDVLCRLPMKSLLQFRCVSKQWRDAISEHRFVQKHLFASTLSDRRMLLVKGISKEESAPACYFTLDFNDHINSFQFSVSKLGFPLRSGPSRVMGSCNGVVLVAFSGKNKVALWNPSARTYRYYPCAWACTSYFSYSLTGLSYDSSVDDYIAIFGTCIDDLMPMWVFSFRTRMWKHMKDIGRLVSDGCGEGITVNGVSHWIMSKRLNENERAIVCYDLVEKGLKEVPLPSEQFLHSRNSHLLVLRECLCVYFYGGFGLICWMMKEYFVRESWSVLFTLYDLPCDLFGFRPKPLFFTSKGYMVVSVTRDQLVLYDPVGTTPILRKIILPGASMECVEAVLVDSLVVPTVGQSARIHC